jgi:peptide/nickel transport system substrate-binding protein
MKQRSKLVALLTAGLVVPGVLGAVGFQAASASTKSAPDSHVIANASSGPSLTLDNEAGETWPCGFNPFNEGLVTDGLTFGEVYEELVFVDNLESGKTTPWLARAYAWSNNTKTLTFTVRAGVKWSDGVPFTANDVLFTFDLLKKDPALDLNSVWSVLSSVSLKGTNQVVFQFKAAATPYFYYIADETPIVPEHIWSKISDPATYLDATPVGTGPYTVGKCTPENVTYTANPLYWQPGLPKYKTVYYPAFLSNPPANEDLANGTAQWGSQFIPNIKGYYLSKSPNNHDWFPPIANVSIFFNLKNPLLANLAVRQAIAYGINRPLVSSIGEYGYEPPSNQTDVVTPTFSTWVNQGLANKYGYTYNPSKAKSVLEKAGFTESGGVMQKDGQKLSFSIIDVGGNTDWVNDLSIIQQELKAVGIQITPENLTGSTFDSKLYTGEYQLGYNAEFGGPSPYYELREILYSANSAPIGQTASTNWERYSNPATDALIDQYATTTNPATQRKITDELEAVMLSQVPVIPVVEEVDWYQYNTAQTGGWATPSNPYAQPGIYVAPDIGVMLDHLYPKN